MAQKVGSLIISLAMESGAFKSGLDDARRKLRAATKEMAAAGKAVADMGKKLSFGVTLPMIAIGKQAVEGFVAQEQAMAQVNAALKSMGTASGKTATELAKTADALEMNSLFDADQILKEVTANLLTFGNVAGREFDRAQQAAVDMATRMGKGPQEAAIMLGKALNNPLRGLTALRKVGIEFTAAQEKQVKAMMAAGDVAGAQGVILSELEKEYKGAAQAAADTSPWRKMQVALGQAGDAIGAQLLPLIKPATEAVISLLKAFNGLSPEAQQTIVKLGLVAAAIGPITWALGTLMTAMAPFTGALKLIAGQSGLLVALRAGLAGLVSAFGPLTLAIGAAYLVWKNWDKIGPMLKPVTDAVRGIGEALGILQTRTQTALGDVAAQFDSIKAKALEAGIATKSQIDDLAASLDQMQRTGKADPAVIAQLDLLMVKLASAGKLAPEESDKIAGALVRLRDEMNRPPDKADLWRTKLNDLFEALDKFDTKMQALADTIDRYMVDPWDFLVASFKGWKTQLSNDWNAIATAAGNLGKATALLANVSIDAVKRMFFGVKTWIGDKLNAVWDGLKKKIDLATSWFYGMADAVVFHSYVPDMVDGIAFHMARLYRVMVEPAKKATEKVKGFFKDLDADIRGMMDELFPDARNLADFQNKLLKFDKAIANGGAGGYSVDQLRAGRSALIDGLDPALRSQVALPLADQLERFGNIDLGNTAPIDAALKAMTEAANDNADKIGVANVAISKSFKDMADATLSALDRMVGAIKGGGFLDILSSVISLGLQLGSIGLFGKSVQSSINAIPAHANGTSFAPGGLSLVGERGPELVNLPRGSQVIPNHALRNGGMSAHITFGVDPNSGNIIPFINGQIAQAAPGIAAAGARGGEARVLHRQSRRVA